MANEKVSQMSSLTAGEAALGDLFMVVDTSAKESKKISLADFLTFIEATGSFVATHATTSDTASYIQGSGVSGTVVSSSYSSTVVSASHANRSDLSATASFALNTNNTSSGTTLTTGSLYQITSSAAISSSYAVFSSFAGSSSISNNLNYTGIPNGTSSFAISCSFSNSSSYAKTASISISSSNAISSSISDSSISCITAATASFFLNRFGPSFITPVIIHTGSSAIAFTVFDASSYLPIGTNVVILDAWAINGSTNTTGFVNIRATGASPTYILIAYESAGSGDSNTMGGQGCFPIFSSGATMTFQYGVTQPADGGVTIRLVGYY